MAIREYVYYCESCYYEFSDFCDWQDAANYKPACAMCKSNEHVYRDFGQEYVSFVDKTPKTIGALADKNSEKRLKQGLSLEQEKTEKNESVIKRNLDAQKNSKKNI